MPLIEFAAVSKRYPGGTQPAVDRLDLAIEKGEFLTLLGPSGSGKTTSLMMLAGFEQPSEGTIRLDGRPIEQLPPWQRNMGVVFQGYALFPHLTVGENVAFPLRVRRLPPAEIATRVRQALDRVHLAAMAERRPDQLSGGQQQRIALARALVFQPDVVLLDEPLAALDKKLREDMQLEIRRLHRELGVTMVFVTHDQGEAMTLSDRVAVFNHGRIEQLGAPQHLYDAPANPFVAGFLGDNNRATVTLAGRMADSGHARLQWPSPGGPVALMARCGPQLAADCDAGRPPREVTLCVRPERLRLVPMAMAGASLAGMVRDAIHQGDHHRLLVDVAHGAGAPLPWRVKLPPHEAQDVGRGRVVRLGFQPDDAWVF